MRGEPSYPPPPSPGSWRLFPPPIIRLWRSPIPSVPASGGRRLKLLPGWDESSFSLGGVLTWGSGGAGARGALCKYAEHGGVLAGAGGERGVAELIYLMTERLISP